MPELPEVETIVRELNRKIAGKTIRRFFVFDKKLPKAGHSLPAKILSVHRHGKYIVFHLSGKKRILIHLRMTGGLFFEKKGGKESHKYERARFLFSDGSALYFCDTRRFGTLEWKNDHEIPNLGINPLSPKFKAKAFSEIVRGSSRAIKNLLLDQKLISGIGNIYADESLWLAKVNPVRKSQSLSSGEIRKLVLAIKSVLRKAIKLGGSTMRDYKRTGGESGSYYEKARKVYDREGEGCFRCETKIKRIKVGGRSSYFCPACQRPTQ